MISPDEFKHVMRRWASTVTIVTTRAGDNLYGLTVTAFSSLSAHPPMVFVCINKAAKGHDAIVESGVFCVNFLGEDMKEMSDRFAKMPHEERFTGLDHRAEVTGAPILPGVLGFFDCRVELSLPAGDHTIFTGKVEASALARPDGTPLLYYNGGYHVLGERT